MNRREAISLPLLLASSGTLARALENNSLPINRGHDPVLEGYVKAYLEAMNGPGLALCTADKRGPLQVSAFGYADLSAKLPLTTSHLAAIGSLGKSFLALAILQLNEACKVELQAPIRHYLPWLEMEADHGEILVHHLLTHSSGMPANAAVFPTCTSMRPCQAFAPGTKFHYCNWGFEVLGQLITHVEGRSWPKVLQDRILRPLGMHDSSATITGDVLSRLPQSYVPLYNDRPYPRRGPIVPAQHLTIATAAGAIAASPADMGRYMQMILNHGAMPEGRLISQSSFELLVTPHIPAPMFGPSAGYGYGIAIDLLDGRRRLKHTGGTASAMSAMQIDIDAGFAAFASINAQLGYRPEPVVEYALRLPHARATQQTDPLPPPMRLRKSPSPKRSSDRIGVHAARKLRSADLGPVVSSLGQTIPSAHCNPLVAMRSSPFIQISPSFPYCSIAMRRLYQILLLQPATLRSLIWHTARTYTNRLQSTILLIRLHPRSSSPTSVCTTPRILGTTLRVLSNAKEDFGFQVTRCSYIRGSTAFGWARIRRHQSTWNSPVLRKDKHRRWC
jgi:CubicO group peptidase (beta-lactamase class C family)